MVIIYFFLVFFLIFLLNYYLQKEKENKKAKNGLVTNRHLPRRKHSLSRLCFASSRSRGGRGGRSAAACQGSGNSLHLGVRWERASRQFGIEDFAIGCDLISSATGRTLGISFDFDARNCAFQVFLGCHEMSIVTS